MHILTIRSDKPEAEIGVYDNDAQLTYHTWEAHHALAETISTTIEQTLQDAGVDSRALDGIIIYKGPGSFTGLRIGVSVANAMADGYKVRIVGAEGDDWIAQGLQRILNDENDSVVLPHYGSEPHITLPKK